MTLVSTLAQEDRQGIIAVCDILAPLFVRDPKDEQAAALVAQLAGLDAAALAEEWPFCTSDEVLPGLAALIDGARTAQVSPDDAHRAWRRLFVGPNHLVAPPWGSVYTDHEKVKFGESCIELGVWMRKHGIASLGPKGEPADHIGTMLALLAWLAQNRPELAEEYLAKHLLTWAEHYLALLADAARDEHELYRGLALAAAATLSGMRETLNLEVSYPRYFM